ncbi:hypothetical protein PO909_008506, partial [Leuciscus waleckii]
KKFDRLLFSNRKKYSCKVSGTSVFDGFNWNYSSKLELGCSYPKIRCHRKILVKNRLVPYRNVYKPTNTLKGVVRM